MSEEKTKKTVPFIPLNDFFDSHGFENGELSSGHYESWAKFLREVAVRCLREHMSPIGITVSDHFVGKTKNHVRLWFSFRNVSGQTINFLPGETANLPSNDLANRFHTAFRSSCRFWEKNWNDIQEDWKEKEQAKQEALAKLHKKKETQT